MNHSKLRIRILRCDEDVEDGDETELDYPWQVQELAIVGNQPCW